MASLSLPKRFRFHVAFSYASDDADYVGRVTAALPEEIKVFDYRTRDAKTLTWGHDLKKQLVEIYKNSALFCVVFMSKAYAANHWTQVEREVASRAVKDKPGYVLPVLLDATQVAGMENLVWIDGSVPPKELAELIGGTVRRPPPRPWWFYLSLQVKVAAAAVLLALILFARPAVNLFRPSRTSIASFGPTGQAITAHLANHGPKSATIVGQRLKFGALPIDDVELRLDKSQSATIAPGERDVKLIAFSLEPKCGADGYYPNNVMIEALLGQHNVTLEVDVRESDDAPGHTTRRIATIPAAKLKPFVGKWVSDRVTPCP
jgi:hypothetical protein